LFMPLNLSGTEFSVKLEFSVGLYRFAAAFA
jgi:hypothetical protein